MHILVAGAAGYIGSVLVPTLLEKGHTVTALDRFYFGQTLVAHPRLTIVRGDTRTFDPSVLKGVEAVIDVAGISNDPSCELDSDLTDKVNVLGGKRLATLAMEAGVKRYVYSSSCSVYGHGEGEGLVETSVRHPVSAYARSKVALEDMLLGIHARGHMEVVILRLATVFGLSPRMRFDLAINVMTKNAYVNRRIMVDGGGRQWRPFVHVKDVADAFGQAVTREAALVNGQVFNVGSTANNLRILNLAFRVRDAVPGTEIVHAATDPDLRDYNVSFEKIEKTLDWRAKYSVDDGVREVLASLRDGGLDPDERRYYTVRQYLFLREAENTMRALHLDGTLLGLEA